MHFIADFIQILRRDPTLKEIGHNSMCPPRALMSAASLVSKASQLARTVSCGCFSHSLSREALRPSTVVCLEAHTLDSKTPHMQKSSGFKSGEFGGHSEDVIN